VCCIRTALLGAADEKAVRDRALNLRRIGALLAAPVGVQGRNREFFALAY
jgi:hypothetical protein